MQQAPDSSGNIRALLVYRNGQQLQRLNVCTNQPVPHTGKLGAVAFPDFNFDGYPDLALLVSSEHDNGSYCVWLFDPQAERFVFSEELSALVNPAPDSEKKEVVSLKKNDCSGDCYERETYQWSESRLLPKSYVALNEDPALVATENCRFVRTVKQEKDGRLREIQRQRVDVGGVPCEPHPF